MATKELEKSPNGGLTNGIVPSLTDRKHQCEFGNVTQRTQKAQEYGGACASNSPGTTGADTHERGPNVKSPMGDSIRISIKGSM